MAEHDLFDVEILALVYGGDAMGRLPDGRAVFVPYALPGERVRLRLTGQKKNFARGALVAVLEPSPDRVTPPCADAAACGGCHYMHIAYPAQLRYKTDILRDQLRRIAGVADPPVAPMLPSPQEWHYRNTVQFHLDPAGRLGFQEPGSHTVVPIQECLLCDPAIAETWPLLDFSDPQGGAAHGIRRVTLRSGVEGDLLLALESDDPTPPEISIDLPINAVFVGPGGFAENAPLVLAGDDYLTMQAAGRLFRVSAGSFFQVNVPQAEAMLRYLLDRLPLDPQALLLEAYAGVGLFTAFLAPEMGRVAAVESNPPSIDDFVANLDEYDHVELYDGTAEEILPDLKLSPAIALVDPPRAGVAQPALDALIRMGAPTLAYVSCDPSTLARDVRRLIAAGYRLDHVQPFDMFPQTYHIETVALMSRR